MAESKPFPTTLILDFYDSYTRNVLSLFSQLAAQSRTVIGEGRKSQWEVEGWQDRVVVVNVDSITWEQFTSEILPHVSCIVLGPGPGSPHKQADFSWPTRLIQEFGEVVPILGLCLGHQGLATAFGSSVVKATTPRHGQVSRIRHNSSDSFFSGVPDGFEAIQYNSLVVAEEGLSSNLEVIAWSFNEGVREIMALRHRTQPLWGVQFHPESISSTHGTTLLSNFLSLASVHQSQSTRIRHPTLPLPPSVLALTTSYKRGLANPVPDIPQPYPSFRAFPTWEQRSAILENSVGKTPQDVFEGLVKNSSVLGEVWLDSARPTGLHQFSHLFAPRITFSHSLSTNAILTRQAVSSSLPVSSTTAIPSSQNFFTTLASIQDTLKRQTRIADSTLPSTPIGFVGYFGYEMKAVTLPHYELPKLSSTHSSSDAEFAFADTVFSYDHEVQSWRATGLVRLPCTTVTNEVRGLESSLQCEFGMEESDWKSWILSVEAFFSTASTTVPTSTPATTTTKLEPLVPDLLEPDYVSAIERARTLIAAGESYELCLTTQFRSTLPLDLASDPYPLYLSLRTSNPAPYSSYFRLPLSNIALLSSSPEKFLTIDKARNAEMKPIKGTVKRSADPVEDEKRRKALEEDRKERAENLMIVDLIRNDLLGFCEVESVEVPRLMVVESFKTVHQLVTSVVGKLTPVVNPFQAVARSFPPGSMTGAPKLRSVRLLEELEGDSVRGVYSGVFGFVSIDGTTDFSVVIRTLVVRGTSLTLGAGGAITYLSEADKEWEEVLVKKEAVTGRL